MNSNVIAGKKARGRYSKNSSFKGVNEKILSKNGMYIINKDNAIEMKTE